MAWTVDSVMVSLAEGSLWPSDVWDYVGEALTEKDVEKADALISKSYVAGYVSDEAMESYFGID
jgi:hypothetical protein